jgi:hypothetical protein
LFLSLQIIRIKPKKKHNVTLDLRFPLYCGLIFASQSHTTILNFVSVHGENAMSDLDSLFAANVKWAEDIRRKETFFPIWPSSKPRNICG